MISFSELLPAKHQRCRLFYISLFRQCLSSSYCPWCKSLLRPTLWHGRLSFYTRTIHSSLIILSHHESIYIYVCVYHLRRWERKPVFLLAEIISEGAGCIISQIRDNVGWWVSWIIVDNVGGDLVVEDITWGLAWFCSFSLAWNLWCLLSSPYADTGMSLSPHVQRI